MKKDISKIIHGKAHIQIGKAGISAGVIEQISKQYNTTNYIKVKFLDSPLDETIIEFAEKLATATGSFVRDVRGKTCVLQIKKSKLKKPQSNSN